MRQRERVDRTTNDGEIKDVIEEEYREETEANWLKAGYKLRRNAVGRHVRSIARSCWIPASAMTWYYYAKKDTRPLTDEEYQKLHDSYVEKFVGWAEIDLAHTTYDGHKWW